MSVGLADRTPADKGWDAGFLGLRSKAVERVLDTFLRHGSVRDEPDAQLLAGYWQGRAARAEVLARCGGTDGS